MSRHDRTPQARVNLWLDDEGAGDMSLPLETINTSSRRLRAPSGHSSETRSHQSQETRRHEPEQYPPIQYPNTETSSPLGSRARRGERGYDYGAQPSERQQRHDSNARTDNHYTDSNGQAHGTEAQWPQILISRSSGGLKSTRPLRRGLCARHIFVISIGAVIGVRFYTRTSVIYGLGGQAGVIYSFAFLGMLAFMVGRCLALMLDQWPVPGALFVLVEKFVDRQVGQAVGPFYWVTYVFAFAVQTTSINSFTKTLGVSEGASIGINIASLLIPILFNLMDLRYFRKIELVLGYLKLMIILAIIILTNVDSNSIGSSKVMSSVCKVTTRENPFDTPQSQFRSYFLALVPCVFLASFTFVGIEVVAATAQEAIVPGHSSSSSARSLTLDGPREDSHNYSYATDSVASPFKRAALFAPIVAVIAYLWGGWIVTETIPPDHPSQPTLDSTPISCWSSSIFVNSAMIASTNRAKAVLGLLIITAASTSCTALYIASRTLYGLAYRVSNNTRHSRVKSIAHALAKTNEFDVPWVAVMVSAVISFLPFLKYAYEGIFTTAISVVTEMSSTSCIMIWGLESLAAFNFLKAYKSHASTLPGNHIRNAGALKVDDVWWYRSHLAMAIGSFILCNLVLFLGGVLLLLEYNDNDKRYQGVAIFLPISIFALLVLILKAFQREWLRQSGIFNIFYKNDFNYFVDMIQHLSEELAINDSQIEEPEVRLLTDLFGIINTDWIFNRRKYRARD